MVTLLAQAALALDKTHAAGIVHRDLKPENLFITRRDDGSIRLKVLDFGIAKVMAQSDKDSKTTRAIGSPLYMSPEQLRGRGNLGPPADIYALAHVAYKLLTGASYWDPEKRETENIYSLMIKIGEGVREAASARALHYGVQLPPGFDAWFAMATAIRPEDRHQRASSLAAGLAEALGQPLQLAATQLNATQPPSGPGAARVAVGAAPAALAPPHASIEVTTQVITPASMNVPASRRAPRSASRW